MTPNEAALWRQLLDKVDSLERHARRTHPAMASIAAEIRRDIYDLQAAALDETWNRS